MDLMDAIYTRRAVRNYSDAPVDEKLLKQLIDAAVQAPSAMNEQPWSFCVIRDRAILDRISQESKAHMLRTTAAGLLSHHFEQILSDPHFDIFYHAPALIVISAPEGNPWGVMDCALAAENLMLAACAAGLGTCWIGFAQAWLGTDDGKVALGLPPNFRPIAPVIVGHPVSKPAPVPRETPDVHWIGR